MLASNEYGDVLDVRDPLGNVTKRHFDVNHNLDWTQPADGNCTAVPAVKCTTYTYDLGDRLLATNRPEADTELVNEYWADGSLKVQNDAGVITTYGYDSAGRLRTVTAPKPAATDPDRVTTYGYDAFGRVRFRQDPTGSCTATPRVACVEYGYDDASRPTTVTYSDPGTPDVTGVLYDVLGRKLSVTTSDTAVSAYT